MSSAIFAVIILAGTVAEQHYHFPFSEFAKLQRALCCACVGSVPGQALDCTAVPSVLTLSVVARCGPGRHPSALSCQPGGADEDGPSGAFDGELRVVPRFWLQGRGMCSHMRGGHMREARLACGPASLNAVLERGIVPGSCQQAPSVKVDRYLGQLADNFL